MQHLKPVEFTMQDVDAEIDEMARLSGDIYEPDNPLAVSAQQYAKRQGLSTVAATERMQKLVKLGLTRRFRTRRLAEDGRLRMVTVWLRLDAQTRENKEE